VVFTGTFFILYFYIKKIEITLFRNKIFLRKRKKNKKMSFFLGIAFNGDVNVLDLTDNLMLNILIDI
jgi:hypothetical protein